LKSDEFSNGCEMIDIPEEGATASTIQEVRMAGLGKYR
jgi:hypothetical protein